MEKTKYYRDAFFQAKVVKLTSDTLDRLCEEGKEKVLATILQVRKGDLDWSFDHIDEFLSEYSPDLDGARFFRASGEHSFSLQWRPPNTEIWVKAPARQEIEQVFSVFEQ